MRIHTDSLAQIFRVATNPKFVLLALALWNFFTVPSRYDGLCFYNWSGALYLAFAILVAALALWLGKWWSYLGAVVSSGQIVYEFTSSTLKIFGVLPVSSDEAEMVGTSEQWLTIMQNHPEEIGQVILAAVIFFYSVICLGIVALNKHRSLNT